MVGDAGTPVVGAPLELDDLERAAGEAQKPDRRGGARQSGADDEDSGAGGSADHGRTLLDGDDPALVSSLRARSSPTNLSPYISILTTGC